VWSTFVAKPASEAQVEAFLRDCNAGTTMFFMLALGEGC
jgi:hypothetical protein